MTEPLEHFQRMIRLEHQFDHAQKANKALVDTVSALEKRIQALELKQAAVDAETSYPSVRPVDVDATDYEEDRVGCHDRVTHFRGLLRGNERQKFDFCVETTVEKYRHENDADDNLILDDNGLPMARGPDDCWIKTKALAELGFKWAGMFRYTCPLSKIRQVPLTMSAYKLLAISRLDPNDPKIDLAFHNKLEASHLCNSGPCANPEHIILETRARNLARKGHQSGMYFCNCDIKCLRNGLVWYADELPGPAAHPALKANVTGRPPTKGYLLKMAQENDRARKNLAGRNVNFQDAVVHVPRAPTLPAPQKSKIPVKTATKSTTRTIPGTPILPPSKIPVPTYSITQATTSLSEDVTTDGKKPELTSSKRPAADDEQSSTPKRQKRPMRPRCLNCKASDSKCDHTMPCTICLNKNITQSCSYDPKDLVYRNFTPPRREDMIGPDNKKGAELAKRVKWPKP